MSSEEISTIAVNPFVRKFVFAIIQSIQAKNFSYEERQVIHAELVPKVSEKVMQSSLGERIILRKRDMSGLVAPIPRPVITRPPVAPPIRRMPPRIEVSQMAPPIQQISLPTAPQGAHIGLSQDYDKITPLLNDPSVSTIECQGAGKPILINRVGQKQITKIVLSADDIKKILRRVSDAAHIPLLEGVFRAAVDNFSINAVISEIIGSKFIIRKQTAYAMLER
ncbi:MAG: hypothetical protein ABIF18_01805 [archaeon]